MKINKIQYLYHGTHQEFDKFDFKYAKRFKDFGKGFYLTSNLPQAQKWAQSKATNRSKAYIYRYTLKIVDKEKWKVLELLRYNKEWVDFISQSRIDGMETDHDIIYDRMADNQYPEISDALQKYADHEITADEVVKRIQCDNDCTDQFCFKNEGALNVLKTQEIFIQYKDEDGKWKLKKE